MYSIHFIVVKAWLESPPLLDFWAFGCVNITFHNLIFFFFFIFLVRILFFFPSDIESPVLASLCAALSFDRQTYIHIYIFHSIRLSVLYFCLFGFIFYMATRFTYLIWFPVWRIFIAHFFFFFGDVGVLFSCFCLFNLCVIFSCKDGKLWVSNLSK